MSGKIVLTNPGGYDGNSFLLVDAVVKQLVADGQPTVASSISTVHQKSLPAGAIAAELRRYINF
jgi:hypothetical protein